ncbi:hypothetical protein V1264_001941 [Littorina saxatilis]|uniref:Uncharacterized protein n=1 Tax=Littorina saxatilis TaxID=31220 RepID=A0AAN9GQC6_9CAEN
METEYEYDIIVYHKGEEKKNASNFCKRVRLIRLKNGLPPNIVTMDEISLPGRQNIANLDDGLRTAKYVFFSHKYYTDDPFGNFAGNVAMNNAFPDRFVRLNIGDNDVDQTYMSFNSYDRTGLSLKEDWRFTEDTEAKIKRMFVSDRPPDRPLYVANPSMTSLTLEPTAAASPLVENTSLKNIVASRDATYPQQMEDDLVEDSQLSAQHDQQRSHPASSETRQPLIARVQPMVQQALQGASSSSTAGSLPEGASGSTLASSEAGQRSSLTHSASNLSEEYREMLQDLL